MVKNFSNNDEFNLIPTKIHINNSIHCDTCPAKLYKTTEYIEYGTGNINSNIIFVLPIYSYNSKTIYSKLLNILTKIYKDNIGKELLEEVYITRAIKCFINAKYSISDKTITNCSFYLNYELYKINATRIIFFGTSYDKIKNHLLPLIIAHKEIHVLANPLILEYDNELLKNKFINNFIKLCQ